MADAFAPVEARYRAQVMQETWGHLAPRKHKTYRGSIVFAIGCYGSDYLNPTVLSSDFPDSPWMYESIMDFLGDGQHADKQRFTVGTVHRFNGSFRNYEWSGTFQQLLRL